ncbi:MAG: flagellar motor switch protein FliM [Pseudomonadota bacterium]|nr:flagellar motor switch protein FliM [Pseudomonadota bacterium]
MSNEFLTQDEVDALLKGATPGGDESAAEAVGPAVRSYNLATQERIVRGRMPALEMINDRFARLLRVGLFNFMRRSPEISVAPVRVLKYGEFIRNLAVPTNLNIAQVKPLRGNALVVIEPNLVFQVVDTMFGGDGRFRTRVEGRDFTQTEMRIIQRLLQVIFEEYKNAWANVYPLSLEYVRSEMHTQFANIANPTEIVVVCSFSVDFGSGGSSIEFVIPYASFEPLRDIIYSPLQGDQAEPDRRWMHMLSRQVQAAEVRLVANLTTTTLRVKELLAMQIGDVLPLDIPPLVTAQVDGVPILECSYGIRNGQYALRIERVLQAESDTA